MNTNDSTDLTRVSVRQRLASLPRFRTSAILLVVLVILLVGPSVAISSTIPTISIPDSGVIVDQSVSINTHNYPANQKFIVTMGPMGTQGINGIKVGELDSGAGGSLSASYAIPEQLKGSYQISIRLESAQGYYSYNWFYNNTAGQGGQPDYTGIPTFDISAVSADQTVTVQMHNFPANQVFKWTMGPMGTQGINGYPVAGYEAWNSGAGGDQTLTLPIPSQLFGSYQISIRAQTSQAYPYYAYNWFYNNSTDGSGTGGTQPPPPVDTGYTGYPTFTVCNVSPNNSIMIKTNNLPPNQVFAVTMGQMWTAGINGYLVPGYEAWNSGVGGTQNLTLPIPSQLYNSAQISVRMQTGQTYPYYAYNWFYNTQADGLCS